MVTGTQVVTFLSKLGKALAEGIAVLTGLGPVIQPLLGSASTAAGTVENTVINDLTSVGQVVVQVEALMQTPGSGATKLAAAAPLVAQIIKTSQLVSGKGIANQALFTQGCVDLTSAVAEILNSLKADVATSGTPVTSLPAPTSNVVPLPASAPAVAPSVAGNSSVGEPVSEAVPGTPPVSAAAALAASKTQSLG